MLENLNFDRLRAKLAETGELDMILKDFMDKVRELGFNVQVEIPFGYKSQATLVTHEGARLRWVPGMGLYASRNNDSTHVLQLPSRLKRLVIESLDTLLDAMVAEA